jgi:NADPH2:quinone reductase
MQAVLCRQHGGPEMLTVEDVPSPQPGAGDVVVAVHAATVSFPDTLIIANKYQLKPALPFSPGGEVAGTVKAVGVGVKDFAPGDRVIAVCGFGGFAEEVVVPHTRVVRVQETVPMDAAAALVLTYGTTQYALQERARLRPGESLLVLGAAGGTGVSAVQIGKLMGARVIAAASTPQKLALCREYGADATIDYSKENLRESVRRLTHDHGVDVVYDPVGGDYTETALRCMAWGGRMLVIGFASGDIPRPPLNLPLLKGCSIIGAYYGGFAEHEPSRHRALLDELMHWLADGRLRPAITSRRPLEEAAAALNDIAARRALGKIVLTTARGRGEIGTV